MNLSDRLESIEIKVRQLALKQERLQRENAALQVENQLLKAGIDKQEAMVIALKDKLETAQRAFEQKAEKEDEQSQQLKQLINQYILEIDKCMEWLHHN
jgi:regulator of replication initiation timing